MAGHENAGVMTGHIGTNIPKFVPPRWGRSLFDPTQTGLCKFGWVWSSLTERGFGLLESSSSKYRGGEGLGKSLSDGGEGRIWGRKVFGGGGRKWPPSKCPKQTLSCGDFPKNLLGFLGKEPREPKT